ncbi:MAG: hypothetical protein LBH22_04825 [Bacteroidales bacterium]|jgi:hypothetical protein|nr:hypothetical protein [Bacteroidales bacterium]
MKKLFYSAAMLAALSFTFVSCKDEDDPKPQEPVYQSITVAAAVTELPSGLPTIARVRAQAPVQTIASTLWSSGFSLKLEDAATSTFLKAFDQIFVSTFPWLTAAQAPTPSLSTARFQGVEIEAFASTEGETGWIGDFFFEGENETNDSYTLLEEVYFFANEDVTITGTSSGIDLDEDPFDMTWNVTLKKGWNKFYSSMTFVDEVEKYTMSFTSTKPAGDWGWKLEDYVSKNSSEKMTMKQRANLRKK